jgi:predicted dehydrogenase
MDTYRSNVGIIGTGFGAKVHLPAFQYHPDFEVSIIAGRNEEKTKKIASENKLRYTTKWKDIINDESIDVVAITTPPYLHYKMAKSALLNKKHIMLEKPTTSNATQAKKLLRIAEEFQLIGMLAHEFRWSPLRHYVKHLIQEEEYIGDIQEINFFYHINFNHAPYGWLFDAKYDGGFLGAAASHYIDLARSISNMELSDVSGKTYIRYPIRKDKNGVEQKVTADDGFFLEGTFENDASLLINFSGTFSKALPPRMLFAGDHGVLHIEGSDLFYAKGSEDYKKLELPKEFELDLTLEEKDYRIPPFLKLLDEFSKSLNEKTNRYGPNLYDGWKNQQILDAVRSSEQTGLRIKINDFL